MRKGLTEYLCEINTSISKININYQSAASFGLIDDETVSFGANSLRLGGFYLEASNPK